MSWDEDAILISVITDINACGELGSLIIPVRALQKLSPDHAGRLVVMANIKDEIQQFNYYKT